MIYLISDNHFGHENIIGYCDRPFETLDEMDAYMIEKWNSIVEPDDVVYNLGDFALMMGREQIRDIVNKLNGYKILVMGNHDKKRSRGFWLDVGFDEVYKEPLVLNEKYLLSHQPMTDANLYNIYGHVHNKISDKADLLSICISVERIDYTPISFEELEDMINHMIATRYRGLI